LVSIPARVPNLPYPYLKKPARSLIGPAVNAQIHAD